MRVAIWTDVICPFCYIGKHNLEAALAQTGVAAVIDWRSFELDPTAPRSLGQSLPELMAAKYRVDAERGLHMVQQQQRAAAEAGLEFNWREARRGNTFDAHRLIHLGAERGCADAVQERFMRAYFTEGAAIGDPDVLLRLAVEAGLDSNDAAAALAGDAFAADVRADERRAAELGVGAVPHFVVNDHSVISGAVSVGELVRVLADETARPADR
jgi:predicted DsbA family dithiol-disulfide isomerase